MKNIYYLNEFELRALLRELRRFNVICVLPSTTSLSSVYYTIIFELDNSMFSIKVPYSFGRGSNNKKAHFSFFLDFVISQIDERINELREFVLVDNLTTDIKTHSEGFYTSILPQICDFTSCGINCQSFKIDPYRDLKTHCKKLLKKGLSPRDAYVKIMSDYQLNQDFISDYIKNHIQNDNGAFFAQ